MSEHRLSTIEIIVIIIILSACTIWLCGCTARNIEYRRWDAQGKMVENTRIGEMKVLYWFGIKDLNVDSDPLKLSVGELCEKNDPNAVILGNKLLDLIMLAGDSQWNPNTTK